MVFCRPLSAKLLMYIRSALFRASASAPARDIFPLLVNEDLRAPVPAYMRDKAWLLSANACCEEMSVTYISIVRPETPMPC